jgi:hypothetical protein
MSVITPVYKALRDEALTSSGNSAVNAWRIANFKNVERGLKRIAVAEEHGIQACVGSLRIKKFSTTPDDIEYLETIGLAPHQCDTVEKQYALSQWMEFYGKITDYGLTSVRVVTTAGVNFIVDAFQNIVELETMRYHGIGTNSGAEAVGDTALGAELSTVYNPDNTRATGTLAEGAANIYRTVGTNTVDGSATITEHGIFSQAATGGGVLLDRSVFAGIGLSSGNSLQSTYDFTITAGS